MELLTISTTFRDEFQTYIDSEIGFPRSAAEIVYCAVVPLLFTDFATVSLADSNVKHVPKHENAHHQHQYKESNVVENLRESQNKGCHVLVHHLEKGQHFHPQQSDYKRIQSIPANIITSIHQGRQEC